MTGRKKNVTRDAAFPAKAELRILDLKKQSVAALRYGSWMVLGGEPDSVTDLPPKLITGDENKFYVALLDSSGVMKDSQLEVVLTSYVGNLPDDARTLRLQRSDPHTFLSNELLLVSDADDLLGPTGSHKLSEQMLHARLGERVDATYPGLVARATVVPPSEVVNLRVHFLFASGKADAFAWDRVVKSPALSAEQQAILLERGVLSLEEIRGVAASDDGSSFLRSSQRIPRDCIVCMHVLA